MRLLAFDGRMGASGDMLLGALLAAGADREALAPVASALGVSYAVSGTTKNGIAATSVDVLLGDGDDGTADEDHDHVHEHDGENGHDHPHDHGHDGENGHDHDHGHRAEGAGPTRTYREVVGIVESMGLPAGVESDALAVFEILGEAEAAVHGVDLDATHFHEVGADDAVADVVGTALLIDDLSPGRVVTTPVATGGGEVEMSHGRYPVPPPAVVEITERADWEIRGGPVEAELLTPTGAAILAHFAEGVGSLPAMSVSGSGYGAGNREFPEHPNVLRALVGDGRGGLVRDEIAVLETNVDDASPEFLGGLQETLADAGARDVTVVPTTMKKSRPGHLVSVIVKPEDAERVARRLAEETGTLGIRESGATHRLIAERRFVTATLAVDGGRREVAVKIASTADGEAYDVSAEYDDAAAVAREFGLPVREVARRAEAAARDGGALARRLVHVVEADRWETVEGAYAPPSLDAEGFVHLSPPERAPGVAQYNYPDAEEPILLVVDRGAVESDLKYEETPTGAFPHLYAELDADAVVEALAFPREDGRYVLPADLRGE